jgi:hypothetical protein
LLPYPHLNNQKLTTARDVADVFGNVTLKKLTVRPKYKLCFELAIKLNIVS